MSPPSSPSVPRRRSRTAVLAIAALTAVAVVGPVAGWAAASQPDTASADRKSAYDTTRDYVIRYYPRFMSFTQESMGRPNTLVGPATMGPEYGVVVAVNDDTLYASAFVDVAEEPQVLTIPQPQTVYSLLTLDRFGNVFDTSIPSQGHGAFALVPQGYSGTIPEGTTKVELPLKRSLFIIRADKYTSAGQNMTAQAEAFRSNLHLTSQSKYAANPDDGKTQLLPIQALSTPMKTMTDTAATARSTQFLTQLQAGVNAPTTELLDSSDQELKKAFDAAFGDATAAAEKGDYGPLNTMTSATRDAHALITDRWTSHVDGNRWVHFDNAGRWGDSYLDRAAFNAYLQHGNDTRAAKYYQAFTDRIGATLDTGTTGFYTITFAKDQIPDAKRFWSLTAYTPDAVELVPNSANKYVVASYTPDLQRNEDGSLTIWPAKTKPEQAPAANWLPTPDGPFSVMLRVYGPTGNTEGTYAPPAVRAWGQL
ncbi:MAG: DUF1214 domain-containing protein [Umezawaea sp.]